jgi:hypothetical protein
MNELSDVVNFETGVIRITIKLCQPRFHPVHLLAHLRP